ncbi:MAG: DUF3095 family protein [Burkholderiales bacterium]|nr:DUF3095 family protein [Burkholderiales bacterium]
MMNDGARFYSDLAVETDPPAELFADGARFLPLPWDWQVILTDVRGSTAALGAGRHQQVNLVATGSIIAALNIANAAGLELPFFFGGDGATLIAPPELAASIEAALHEHRLRTRANFGLDLRVGSVSVESLYASGHGLAIAKVDINRRGLVLPVALGDGLQEAERIIKARDGEDPGAAAAGELNLEGMECRWDSIGPPEGAQEVVCLLVVVRDMLRQAAILADVLRLIDAVYGPLEKRLPISRPRLRLAATPGKIATEMRARLGRFDLAYLLRTWFYTVVGRLWWAGSADGARYIDRLVELSDTLMLDGRVNTVISGTANQRAQLTQALSRMEAAGEIVFGLESCPASVMSCYVRDRKDGHIHFVDGQGGGYTRAAAALKLKAAALSA